MIKCKECNRTFKRNCDFTRHINLKHKGGIRAYYDKYLKTKSEGFCELCGNKTDFDRFARGYKRYCSKKCRKKGRTDNIASTTYEKYEVDNVNHLKEVRDKIRSTNEEKYGNACPMQEEGRQKAIQKKNMENLGVNLPFQSRDIQLKSAKVREERYGAKYTYQSSILQEKIRKTNLKKYGVEYPLQCRKIFDKHQSNRFKRKMYKNTNIYYQGTYEYDFLDKYLTIFPDMENGPTIRYFYDKKWKIYYPDFYIPSLNLIVEIKGSYFIKENLKNKKDACEQLGYNWIMILDKDYSEFVKYKEGKV